MKKIVIAIDPGASGATAVQYTDGSIKVFPWKSEFDFTELIRELSRLTALPANRRYPIAAYVELVGGYIGQAQPGSAMFKFGRNDGYIAGTLAAFKIPVRYIRPAAWQKGLPRTPKLADKGAAKAQHKRDLRDVATKLFPQLKPTLATADALLILDCALKVES